MIGMHLEYRICYLSKETHDLEQNNEWLNCIATISGTYIRKCSFSVCICVVG